MHNTPVNKCVLFTKLHSELSLSYSPLDEKNNGIVKTSALKAIFLK